MVKVIFRARKLKIGTFIVLATENTNLKPEFGFLICGRKGRGKSDF